MPISDRIGPHLPALRRYARALTGTQPSGDAYVAATLETILVDPSVMPEGEDDKATLFGLLSRIISSLPVSVSRGAGTISPGTEAPFDLSGVPPLARQALLLATVEGFTVEKTAAILDAEPTTIRTLLDAAFAEIAAQAETGIMIIEDEPLIALDLAHMVNGMGHRVTGIARTHTEAVDLARRKAPGLILADIQLADGSSGLDAVNELIENTEVPVIFITAYPERFLTGVRPEPAFLIAKPFQPSTVAAVISQALFFERRARPREQRASA